LKIVALKGEGNIAPYIIDSYVKYLKKLGHTVFLIDTTEEKSSVVERFGNIQRYRPQLALAYGVNGIIKMHNTYFFRSIEVPLVSLFYDNPFFFMTDETESEIFDNYQYYYNFIWDECFLKVFLDRGFKNVYPLMLAADTDMFFPMGQCSPEHDLCFVGSIDTTKADNFKTDSNTVNFFIDAVIETKKQLLKADMGVTTMDICSELFKSDVFSYVFHQYLNQKEYFWKHIYYLIHAKGSPTVRREILSSIDNILHLYSDIPLSKDNIVFHPAISYGTALSRVYQSYKINLNITSLQLEASINNRVFDVFASGGFLLSDYKKDMEKVLPDHWRDITFKNLDDMASKCEHYLSHENERKELTEEIYRHILKNHTYKNRAEDIIRVAGGIVG